MDETNPQTASGDPFTEIDAMRSVAEALRPLDGDAVQRVLRWAYDHFGQLLPKTPSNERLYHRAAPSSTESSQSEDSESRFDGLAELYAACRPRTDADKTLVVCYWLQEINESKGIDARVVNDELKHLGHGIGNITRAFDRLKRSRPQLVIQTKKAGTTKQARKTYKMTVEGKSAVEQLLQTGGAAE